VEKKEGGGGGRERGENEAQTIVLEGWSISTLKGIENTWGRRIISLASKE